MKKLGLNKILFVCLFWVLSIFAYEMPVSAQESWGYRTSEFYSVLNQLQNENLEEVVVAVLDTGIDMRKNWELYGLIHLDVAFVTEKDPAVYSMTASNQSAKFQVKRWGW